jgi:hypothetical protein
VEFANPAGVTLSIRAFEIRGDIRVSAGEVTGPSQASVHTFGTLSDAGGGWGVPLVVRSPAVTLPASVSADVSVGGRGSEQSVEYGLTRDLTVNGAFRVNGSSRLTLAGGALSVNGNLITAPTGSVVMDSDDDRVTVDGYATFGQNATASAVAGALFSAGRFEITGNLTERINRYRASGSHVTAFTGTAPQTASASCHYSNCGPYNASASVVFQGVEVSNPAGVTFQGRTMGIGGEVRVLAGGAAVFDQNIRLDRSLDVAGAVTLPSGRTLVVTEALILRATGLLTNNGSMTVGSCTKEDGHTLAGTDPCG